MAYPSASPNSPSERGVALAIGNFDGVHAGHQSLVRRAVELAEADLLAPKAMTFEPHPAKILGGKAPPQLTRLARKVELLKQLAPSLEVIVQSFDEAFARLSPRDFVVRTLVETVRVRHLVVGANFRFGRDRTGTVAELAQLGQKLGFDVHPLELSGDGEGSFSSSRIRRLVELGSMKPATFLLTRPHCLIGSVVRGDGRGRSIGFATANLEGIEEQLPADGVYAAMAELPEGTRASAGAQSLTPAAVHVGPRPTVERGRSVEAHLIGAEGDFYGCEMRLHLLDRVRGLVKFDGIDSLKAQIARDVETTLAIAAAHRA